MVWWLGFDIGGVGFTVDGDRHHFVAQFSRLREREDGKTSAARDEAIPAHL